MVKVLIYIIVSNIGWFLFVELVKAIVPDVVFVIVFYSKGQPKQPIRTASKCFAF